MRNGCIFLGAKFRLKNNLGNLSAVAGVRKLNKVGHKDADWINEAHDGDPMTGCFEQGNEHADSNNYANNCRHN